MNGSGPNVSGESRNQSIRDKERRGKADIGHLFRVVSEVSDYYNRGPGHTADTTERVSPGLEST